MDGEHVARSEYGDAWVEGRGRAPADVLADVDAVREQMAAPSVRVRAENGPAGADLVAALLARGFEFTGLERDGDAVHATLGQALRRPLTRPRVLPPTSLRVVVVWWELLGGAWHVLLAEQDPPMAEPYLNERLGDTVDRVLMTGCAERLDHEGIVGLGWGPLEAGRTVVHAYVRVRPGWRTTSTAATIVLRRTRWVAEADVPPAWGRLRTLRDAVVLSTAEDARGTLHALHEQPALVW